MRARLSEDVELGGDLSGTYIYVANSHDGPMAVTATVTPIRIVCANTLGAALRRSDHGAGAQRTFRFRHTGNLLAKFAEARQVLGMTIDYAAQFKELAHRLARESITLQCLEHSVLRSLWVIDEDMGKLARRNREHTIAAVLDICPGSGIAGDTTRQASNPHLPGRQSSRGNSPGSKWVAWNAIAEQLDCGRRYTARTNQVQRSFEDVSLKERALDLVIAA